MARLRYNGLATGAAGSAVGLTLGASLTSSATSMTLSAAPTYSNGTALPTIASPDYLPVQILDANGHLSEVVWITAHTSGGTTPTILRGQEGTTGVAHSSGDKIVHGPLVKDIDNTRTVNAQTGTSYTLVLGDANGGGFVTMTNAAASTLTVPPNSSVAFPVGTVIEGVQLGAGQVTLTPGSGVTINATPGLKIAAQYGTFGLLKTATDTWLAYGRLSA